MDVVQIIRSRAEFLWDEGYYTKSIYLEKAAVVVQALVDAAYSGDKNLIEQALKRCEEI